jgi:uncharacterized membrane protein
MKIKENGLIDDKHELIIKEFQTILSVFYLLLVGIGMLFSYSKYSQFGINIFQYSDIFDFLLTPFRDITIFLFSFITIFMVYLVYKLNKFTKRKFPKYYNSRFNFGLMKSNPFLSMIMMFILYLFLFSYKYGKLSTERILVKPNITELTLSNGEIKTGNLFGKNNGYVFLLENNNNEVNIYPITNIISIIKIK